MNELMMPPVPQGTVQEQLAGQYVYLFQMAQQLNLALSQWESAAQAQTRATQAMQASRDNAAALEESYDRLRSLIVKTADAVEQRMDRLRTDLAGEYMALSDFGAYVERLSATLEANPAALTQYYSYFSELRGAVDAVDAELTAYRAATEGYIQTGIVDYDGAVPVYGVAVGQALETSADPNTGEKVIEKKNFRAVFTAQRLGFWEDGVEVAHVSNRRLYITHVMALSTLTVGEWRISGSAGENGLLVQWIGG